MKILTLILPIPAPAAMQLPAVAKSISTPPIRQVLSVALAGQNIAVEVDCDENQPPITCDWFVIGDGQIRPASGLINLPIRLPRGTIVRVASTCIA